MISKPSLVTDTAVKVLLASLAISNLLTKLLATCDHVILYTCTANVLSVRAIIGIFTGLLMFIIVIIAVILCICCVIPTCPLHHSKCCANHTVAVDQPAPQLTKLTAVATSITYHEPSPPTPYNPDAEYKPYHPSDGPYTTDQPHSANQPYPTNQPYTMALP